MVTAKCTSTKHETRDAVGRFKVVNFFAGGQITYLCGECAEQYGTPDGKETEAWAISQGWQKQGELWVHNKRTEQAKAQ